MKHVILPSTSRFVWTAHAKQKMHYYGLSASRVLRAFHHPARVEEGIAPGTVAVMQPVTTKHTSEIWLMYAKDTSVDQIRIITAWRYPGKSRPRTPIPIPEEIKRELKLGS